MKAFRCSHSGLYFPDDYVKQWGRKYGIGLGRQSISEVLDTDYAQPVCTPEHDHSRSMHPVGVTRVQVDLVEVSEEEYESNRAIVDLDDPKMIKRAALIQEKQKINSQKLRAILV